MNGRGGSILHSPASSIVFWGFCLSSNYIPILKKLSKNDFFHMQTMSWTGPLTPDEYNDTMVTGLSSSAN